MAFTAFHANSVTIITCSLNTVKKLTRTISFLRTHFIRQNHLMFLQINFVVNAGKPTKLCPLESPGTPTVSNTHNPQSRYLIRSTKFQLQVSIWSSQQSCCVKICLPWVGISLDHFREFFSGRISFFKTSFTRTLRIRCV